MRILVFNPNLIRLNSLGACEQDRLQNVHDLIRLGHQVLLFTGYTSYQKRTDVESFYAERGLSIHLIPPPSQRFHPRRWTNLAYLDGATWEFGQPRFVAEADKVIKEWKPDLVWCHTTYNWVAASVARRRGIPTVVRSVNYEAETVLQELGNSPRNQFRAYVKRASERAALRAASVLAAITPDEQRIYEKIDPQAVVSLLPLRALPRLLRSPRPAREHRPLRLFFMGSTYNVHHNASALRFIVEGLLLRLREASPGTFEIHIMGSKVPTALSAQAAEDLIFDGYVPDIDTHLEMMDIALAPSLFGTGMQQKVFEPLCRAFPTVTHPRGLAGYDFQDGVHLLMAEDATGYVEQLLRLRDPALRQQLSDMASQQAARLFNPSRYDDELATIFQHIQHEL